MEKQYRTDLREILTYINPCSLSYQEWINVGMGLKESGYTVKDWDDWSRQDSSRYHRGECERKWETFSGCNTPITGGTIVQMALESGWSPSGPGHILDWDDEIQREKDDLVIINQNWIEGKEVTEPQSWNPAKQLITYLTTLFESTENVGYVTKSWENSDGKYVPDKGCWDRTAGQLIQELSKCGGDIGGVLGDYNPEVGAWIRF